MKLLYSLIVLLASATSSMSGQPAFVEKIIDADAPQDLWMKTVGDINNDGKQDILAGGWEKGGMVAYLAPEWKKTVITESLKISTDAEVKDLDNDKVQDIVAVVDQALVLFSGPGWPVTVIDSVTAHDLEVQDFDNNGLFDIVARNQGAFGDTGGHTLYFYSQTSPGVWRKFEKEIVDGEGLKIADLNSDGREDVITNAHWFENTGDTGNWKEHRFSETWKWPNAFIDVADINKDGRPDILHSPSELAGNFYHISWFEAPVDPYSNWEEHVIQDSVETVVHSIGAADFNLDGRMDVIVAEMQQGADPDNVTIFYNQGEYRWINQVISSGGSHSMRILDLDGDGDMDVFGANFAENVVKMWGNCSLSERR